MVTALEDMDSSPADLAVKYPGSKTAAIGAKCFWCVGGEANYRSRIVNCNEPDCPLYGHRPLQPV